MQLWRSPGSGTKNEKGRHSDEAAGSFRFALSRQFLATPQSTSLFFSIFSAWQDFIKANMKLVKQENPKAKQAEIMSILTEQYQQSKQASKGDPSDPIVLDDD